MTSPCAALRQARGHVLGLLLAPARVGIEVMGQLVDASMRTTCAVWTQLLSVPSSSETPDYERTAERRPPMSRPAADGTEPGRRARSDANRPAKRETRAASALTEHPSSLDLLPAEPVSTELVPTERVSIDVVPADQPATDQPSPEQSLARTSLVAGTITGTVDVTFRLPAAVGAHSVHVCGEFNDWSTTADPMNHRDDGSFELVRAIPVGRRWRFRYLLDGNRWENDWTADDYPANTFGSHDSVVDLRTPSTSRLVSEHRPPTSRN